MESGEWGLRMIKLSVFQKEILINFMIFIIGILLDILGVFIKHTSSIPISDICIGIGCSLIASSFVSFMSLLYREKAINVNCDIKNTIVTLYNPTNVDNKINNAKSQIDICYPCGRVPYALIGRMNFENLLLKGVNIRIILSEIISNTNDYDTLNMKKEECIEIISDLMKRYPNNIKLAVSSNIIPLKWIRIDNTVVATIDEFPRLKRKPITLEVSKYNSKDIFKQYEMQFEEIWEKSKHFA